MIIVKSWCFCNSDLFLCHWDNKYNNETPRLVGYVYNHNSKNIITGEFKDGHRIVTSPIKIINWKEQITQTESGTIYRIENINKNYEKWLLSNRELKNVFSILPSNVILN